MTDYEYVDFKIARNPDNTKAEIKFTQQNIMHSGLVEPNMPKYHVIEVDIKQGDTDEDLMKKAIDKLPVEYLQEINIYTEKGNILKLFLSEMSGLFKLFGGEYFDNDSKQWGPVPFSDQRVNDCNKLLEECLRNFSASRVKNGDCIVRVHNPCNTPFVTGPQQYALLQLLNIAATVQVN